MSDVAAGSGGVDNVYGVLTQYTDSAGPAAYAQTFGSAQVINDSRRYPANNGGCSVDPGTTACVSDAQVQAEVARLISADRLPSGVGSGGPDLFRDHSAGRQRVFLRWAVFEQRLLRVPRLLH
jgi:hypothetical protein